MFDHTHITMLLSQHFGKWWINIWALESCMFIIKDWRSGQTACVLFVVIYLTTIIYVAPGWEHRKFSVEVIDGGA